jgi:thiol-disulfide isomerase/thioredoxin
MGAGEQPRRQAPRPGARYVAFVGLAFLLLIGLATYNSVRTASGGLLGVSVPIRGRPLPEFAVPKVRGGPDADANIFQDDCASSDNPCPPGQRRRAACRIPRPLGAIRVCDLFNRPLVISFWFLTGASCLTTQDVVDHLARRFEGRVNFLSIDVHDNRADVNRTVAERGWRIPVGWDRDGAVSDLYRVGGCPTVAFAYPGGIFAGARAGEAGLTAPRLTAAVRGLLADSRHRAARSR